METDPPLESSKKFFKRKIFSYILDSSNDNDDADDDDLKEKAKSLLKFNKSQLKINGDIVFDVRKDIWLKCWSQANPSFKSQVLEDFNSSEDQKQQAIVNFLSYASKWQLPVREASINREKCILRLDRVSVMKTILQKVNEDPCNYGCMAKQPNKTIKVIRCVKEANNSCEQDLSLYRANLISKIIENLLHYSDYTVNKSDETHEADKIVMVKSLLESDPVKSIINEDHNKVINIKTGLVLDPETKKVTTLLPEEYQKIKSEELHLTAVHKYGIRSSVCPNFLDLKHQLGEAAVKVDLLEIKHSSPVTVIKNGKGSTRGSTFILYNTARLETLIGRYKNQVNSGQFNEMPDVEALDFSLLKEEDEWELVFCYVMEFANIIEDCLNRLESGVIPVHAIIQYLNSFVTLFSSYYRRTRILTENRKHLMPYIHVRVYLIEAIQSVLNKTLRILTIEPVSVM